MLSNTDRLVTFRGGFVLPESVVRWLFDAHDRGLTFELHDDKLRVRPAENVRPADDRFIREHRDSIRAAVAYIDEIARAPL